MCITTKVVKKNKTQEDWNFEKVVVAVSKSARRVNKSLSKSQLAKIEEYLTHALANREQIAVQEVHNLIEVGLNQVDKDVALSYMNYRNYKKDIVEMLEGIYQKTKDTLYVGDRENANFNSALISTKGSLVRGYLTKELYKQFYISEEERNIIESGELYFHDLRDLIFGQFNCCLCDVGTVLKGGFEMGGVWYKEPKSVLTALQVIGDLTLCKTAQQFGGFTIPEIDKILVPYVRKTEQKLRNEATLFGIRDADSYVEEKLTEEINQGIQSLEMKLNTVPSSRGDTAFVTISFGCCDNEEDAATQRRVCRAILHTRMHGQGNGAPVVFPKLVYLYSSEQHKDPEQQKLFDQALLCSSKSMYPDFLSLDAGYTGDVFKRTGKVISPMGCRAYLSDYQDENGESYFVGRANIGAVSLNLPMIWMLSKSNGAAFYEDLDYYLGVARQFLKKRYEITANNRCSTNPIAFTQGGIRGGTKQPDEKIGLDIIKSFTASFGITSLNELNVLMEGRELHEVAAGEVSMAEKVVDYIEEKVAEFKKEDGYLYALYGTPAESLAGTQLQQFRAKYGVIPKVSDREYFSNSFHCHVSADIDPFTKQDLEYALFHKINGGHIQYVRLDNPSNVEAIRAVVLRGMAMGFYQGVNFDLVVCEQCGHRPTSIVDECPLCKSTDITIISRVCGYLGIYKSSGNTRFNDSKLAEVADRVSM